MHIQERSVTKYYWKNIYKYLFRKIKIGKYRWVTSDVIRIDCGADWTAWAIVIEHRGTIRPIAWLYVGRRKGWKAFEVKQIFTMPSCRGKGYARKLFKTAIINDREMIASGLTHTTTSAKMWKSFIRDEVFNIWAHDFWHLGDRADVAYDDDNDELVCGLELYYKGDLQERDVRFVAVRNK